jgi:predicted amidohydrolase YtcJ
MTDLIIINAQVTTLDPSNPVAEAVAIRDGKILVAGSKAKPAPPRPRPRSSMPVAAA